jgi:hypothetical protein
MQDSRQQVLGGGAASLLAVATSRSTQGAWSGAWDILIFALEIYDVPRPVLTRDELRAICDREQTKEKMLAALPQNAPSM